MGMQCNRYPKWLPIYECEEIKEKKKLGLDNH